MRTYVSQYSETIISARIFKGEGRTILIICEPNAPCGDEIQLQMQSQFTDKLERIAAAINTIMTED